MPWRAARSDGVSRACAIRSKRPAETPPLPIKSRASASMLRVQSTMRSPIRPRPRKFAAPKAKSATRIAAMNGKIRRQNSSQDGRTIAMATSSGDNRSMKPGKDSVIVLATFRLRGRCAVLRSKLTLRRLVRPQRMLFQVMPSRHGRGRLNQDRGRHLRCLKWVDERPASTRPSAESRRNRTRAVAAGRWAN